MKNATTPQNIFFFNNIHNNLSPEELQETLHQYQAKKIINPDKEVVVATIIDITERDLILDLNTKANGIISRSECKDLPNLKIGDEVEVYVQEQENLRGELVVSRKGARIVRAWETLQSAHQNEEIMQGVVKRKIKGGLVVDLLGIETFLPGSHINIVKTTNFDEYVGNILEVLVVRINEKKDNVVVSRKALIEKEQAKQREVIIKGLKKGQILSGIIAAVTNFGLFVDLGGVQATQQNAAASGKNHHKSNRIVGLLHKKDLASSKKIDNLQQLKNPQGEVQYQTGQPIQVAIKDFDPEKNYISLSTKMITWDKLPTDITEGSHVTGVVKDIEDYYALVEIMDGVVGLLHISEMSHSNAIKHPKELLTLEQKVELQVLDIDREAQELRLGMKQLIPNPWETASIDKYVPGQTYTGRILSINKNGMYVEFEQGIEGFLHKRNLSWTQKTHDLETMFKEDDNIQVILEDVDRSNKLLVLTLKDPAQNPWPAFKKIFTPGSLHEGNVVKRTNGGIIVELEQGLQTFVPSREFDKKGSQKIEIGATMPFYVIEFSEDEQKVILSKTNRHATAHDTAAYQNTEVNNTLGDLEVLKQLKKELTQQDQQERKAKTKK